MTELPPNVALLSRFDPANVADCQEVFAENIVFHYFNPMLPDLQGDYRGRSGIQEFFGKIEGTSQGTFKVNPVSITPVGDELVVVHVRNTMTIEDRPIEVDAVVVWRIVDGQIAEAWDIPAVYSVRGS